MGHPDSGLIQALLDGEVDGSEEDAFRAHLESCPECEAKRRALEAASRRTADSLLLIDEDPRFQEARNRILAKGRRGPRRTFWSSMSLPKAASVALLLSAAAATALPGSPVQRWMVQGWEALTEGIRSDSDQRNPGRMDEAQPVLPPEALIPETGASILASSEGVEIWIHDLPLRAGLRVLWIDGDQAWIYAGEGTRFSLEGGRLEAFSPPGAVRVEIPRTLEKVELRLDGSLLLRKSGGEVEIVGPVQQRTPSEILFEALGSTNDGQP